MSPVAQHKLFSHFKRITCKIVEGHHIFNHAEIAAYHAYRSTITASEYFQQDISLWGGNWLLGLNRKRSKKILYKICYIYKCPVIDLKAMKRIQPTVQHHSLVSLEEEKS